MSELEHISTILQRLPIAKIIKEIKRGEPK